MTSVANTWAQGEGWTIVSVSTQPSGVIIRATGPLPEPDTASLSAALATAGLGGDDIDVELVPSHTVELSHGT